MSKEVLAPVQQHTEYIEKNLALIQNQFQLSKSDLENFAIQCKRTGLDPITRQIYAIPNNGKLTIMASIDGLRLIAERSGQYQGQTKAEWCGDDGKWVDVWLHKTPPMAARVGVYKTNFKEALVAVALYDEYAGKRNGQPTFMWAKMPALMIAKVAEALALRKAFPNEMSGIYSTEEMDQANDKPEEIAREVTPKPAPRNPLKEENDPGKYVISFGKHKGKALESMDQFELSNYLNWVLDSAKKDNKEIKGSVKEFVECAEEYLMRSEKRRMNAE